MSESKTETKTDPRRAKISRKKRETSSLTKQNAKLKEEVELYKDKWLRTVAEFENFRKRNAKERIDWIKNANQSLLLEIVDVFEHLELAVKSAKKEKVPSNFLKGIKITYEQLKQILEREGVKKIETIGKKFEPNLHEAVAYIEDDKYDTDIIFDNIRNGYLLHDKVLRHARVAVSKGKKKGAKKPQSLKDTKK